MISNTHANNKNAPLGHQFFYLWVKFMQSSYTKCFDGAYILFMIIKDFLNSSKSGTPLEKKKHQLPNPMVSWIFGSSFVSVVQTCNELDGQYALKDYGFTKTNGQYKQLHAIHIQYRFPTCYTYELYSHRYKEIIFSSKNVILHAILCMNIDNFFTTC